MSKNKKEDELNVCVDDPASAEHARPNEPGKEPCDDGRSGIINQKSNKDNKEPMNERKDKDEKGQDLVNDRKKERQDTMDKMSVDSSMSHTYDKDKSDDGAKSS